MNAAMRIAKPSDNLVEDQHTALLAADIGHVSQKHRVGVTRGIVQCGRLGGWLQDHRGDLSTVCVDGAPKEEASFRSNLNSVEGSDGSFNFGWSVSAYQSCHPWYPL